MIRLKNYPVDTDWYTQKIFRYFEKKLNYELIPSKNGNSLNGMTLKDCITGILADYKSRTIVENSLKIQQQKCKKETKQGKMIENMLTLSSDYSKFCSGNHINPAVGSWYRNFWDELQEVLNNESILALLLTDQRFIELFEKKAGTTAADLFQINNVNHTVSLSALIGYIDSCVRMYDTEQAKRADDYQIADEIIQVFFDYDHVMELQIHKDNIRNIIYRKMNVRVCPYCNCELIAQTHSRKSVSRNLGDLDHWLPKERFPLFSLSVWNFIPSCKVCNELFKGKSEKKLVNPWHDGFDSNVNVKFKITDESVHYIDVIQGNTKEFSVNWEIRGDLNEQKKLRIENSINVFGLDDVYSEHSDEIQRFMRMKYYYPEAYRDFLRKLDSKIGIQDENEIIDESDYQNVIFGRLKHDLEKSDYLLIKETSGTDGKKGE